FLLVVFIIAVVGIAAIWSIQKRRSDQLARTQEIVRVFSKTYTNDQYGFEISYPVTADVWLEQNYVNRPWQKRGMLRSLDTPPELGNRIVTKDVVLDNYFIVRIWETIDVAHNEYIDM